MRRCAFLQTQTTSKSEYHYENEANRDWYFWRPIVERMSTFEEMERRSLDEVMEFNAAIDIQIKKINEAKKNQK